VQISGCSSLGQNLSTTTYLGEIIFSIIVATLGLVLFGFFIGNMQVMEKLYEVYMIKKCFIYNTLINCIYIWWQTYLQSMTVRFEEWRIKKTDSEQWMRHRQLPSDLRQSVRKYNQYEWVATRGVDEDALLKALPLDLRRDIRRHLCLDLVRRVS
jgi:cyclic nucleotide gated channel